MSGGPLDNPAAELHTFGPEPFDCRADIGDRDLETVPAARGRRAAGDSRATDTWFVQEQPQIAPHQARESGRARQIDAKAEPVAIKLDRGFNILDEIADSHLCHWSCLLRGCRRNGFTNNQAQQSRRRCLRAVRPA